MEGFPNRFDQFGADENHRERQQQLYGFIDCCFTDGKEMRRVIHPSPFSPVHQAVTLSE